MQDGRPTGLHDTSGYGGESRETRVLRALVVAKRPLSINEVRELTGEPTCSASSALMLLEARGDVRFRGGRWSVTARRSAGRPLRPA